MSGNKEGALKAVKTIKEKYGDDFYHNIGKKNKGKPRKGGFASEKVGKDGLTGRERAKIVGRKGGLVKRK